MKQVLVILLSFVVVAAANAAVIFTPTEQTVVAIKFGRCTSELFGNNSTPGDNSSTPMTEQVKGALALHSSDVDCSADGGTVIGTSGLVALGTVATLERDSDTLSSYPIGPAKKTGVLKKGSTIRILAYGGLYRGALESHGDMYIIAEVVERK